MMEVSIKDFLDWYREGSYNTNDLVIIHEATNGDVDEHLYGNNETYRSCLITWMKDIYGLMSKLANQFLLDNFYIKTNCDERYRNKTKQYRILLLPYDRRLEVKYRLEIRIDDSDERKYVLINEKTTKFGTEAGLLKALNDIHPESNAVTYHIELTFLWDDGGDTKDALITVPGNVTVGRINFILKKKHGELEKNGVYFEQGRNPETLLNEVCRENGWTWEENRFDLVETFN